MARRTQPVDLNNPRYAMAPGSGLQYPGSSTPRAKSTNPRGSGPSRNQPRNQLAPGSQLGGSTSGAQQPQSPAYSGTTTTAPAAPAPTYQFDPNSDPTYRANVASETKTINDQIAGYQLQQQQLQNALGDPNNPNNARTTTLGDLQYKEPLLQLAAKVAAARSGAASSGSLFGKLGLLASDYATNWTNAVNKESNAYSNLATQITNAQDTLGNYITGQKGDATARASAQAAANPAIGGAAAVPGAATSAATSGGGMLPATIATHQGGKFYNWYVQAYGKPPPAMVSPNAARYVAWTKGVAPGAARGIAFGSVAK